MKQVLTAWGSSGAAKAYRATQAKYIGQGNFLEAQKMDIADVTSKFPGVYDTAIKQMVKYSEGLP